MSELTSGQMSHEEFQLADGQEIELYIGKGSHLHGVFHIQGTARIDGTFEGEIHSDNTVQVGKDASISGNIHANYVIAQGPIYGDLVAKQGVRLLAPATVEGAIESPIFTLEEGVLVAGMLKMKKAQGE